MWLSKWRFWSKITQISWEFWDVGGQRADIGFHFWDWFVWTNEENFQFYLSFLSIHLSFILYLLWRESILLVSLCLVELQVICIAVVGDNSWTEGPGWQEVPCKVKIEWDPVLKVKYVITLINLGAVGGEYILFLNNETIPT